MDTWQSVLPDRALIKRKLALYGMAFSVEVLEEALTRVTADDLCRATQPRAP